VWGFMVSDLSNSARLVEERLKTKADFFFNLNKITLPFLFLFTVDEFSPFSKLPHQKNSEKSLCYVIKST